MSDDTKGRSAISAYLAEIGSKGGRIGGKRRLETMTADARSQQASVAARARWSKPPREPGGEIVPDEGYVVTKQTMVQCRVCRSWFRPQHQHAKRGVILPSSHMHDGGMCIGFIRKPLRIKET